MTDPQKDNVTLMDGQISNKKSQLEQEKLKTLELEKQVEELKQMSILQELIKVKIQCDRAQKEYQEMENDLEFYYSFDRF